MPETFEAAVESVGRDLIATGQVGSHVHFDDPQFKGLVPPFNDAGWIRLAASAASVLSHLPGRILVDVPLGTWENPPDPVQLLSLVELDPWEPPAIYLLSEDRSALAHRIVRGWYSDEAPATSGAIAWFGGHLEEAANRRNKWRISLMYETDPARS